MGCTRQLAQLLRSALAVWGGLEAEGGPTGVMRGVAIGVAMGPQAGGAVERAAGAGIGEAMALVVRS